MKTVTIATLTVALFAAGTAATAQAQTPMTLQPYVGGDALFWSLDPEGARDFESTGLRLNGGVQFSDYFAVEGHLGTGGSDTQSGVKGELDHVAGVYAKGIVPVAPQLRLYGLLGVSEVEGTFSAAGFKDSDRETDLSYGAGAEFDLAPNLAVGADYMRYLDKSEVTFDAASVGLRYRF